MGSKAGANKTTIFEDDARGVPPPEIVRLLGALSTLGIKLAAYHRGARPLIGEEEQAAPLAAIQKIAELRLMLRRKARQSAHLARKRPSDDKIRP